jgi:hypothetical protein
MPRYHVATNSQLRLSRGGDRDGSSPLRERKRIDSNMVALVFGINYVCNWLQMNYHAWINSRRFNVAKSYFGIYLEIYRFELSQSRRKRVSDGARIETRSWMKVGSANICSHFLLFPQLSHRDRLNLLKLVPLDFLLYRKYIGNFCTKSALCKSRIVHWEVSSSFWSNVTNVQYYV